MSSTIVTINPATGAELERYPAMTRRADRRRAGHVPPPRSGPGRVRISRCAPRSCAPPPELLRERDDELALLVTREMGKPLAEARAEVHKCADGLEFYAEHAHEFPGRRGL